MLLWLSNLNMGATGVVAAPGGGGGGGPIPKILYTNPVFGRHIDYSLPVRFLLAIPVPTLDILFSVSMFYVPSINVILPRLEDFLQSTEYLDSTTRLMFSPRELYELVISQETLEVSHELIETSVTSIDVLRPGYLRQQRQVLFEKLLGL